MRLFTFRPTTPRFALFALLVLALVFASACSVYQPEPRARYVFLMIGDGMATNQKHLAEIWAEMDGNASEHPRGQFLAMNRLPVRGEMDTLSANSLITDSAAAGTAMACGVKTNNGAIAVATDGKTTLTTIAEAAHQAGFRVGIISSVSLDHATPASFYAHNASRNNYYEISRAIPASGFEFFAGGGVRVPADPQNRAPVLGEAARQAGYTVIARPEELATLTPGTEKVLALTAEPDGAKAFPYVINQKSGTRPETFSLADLTEKAAEMLEGPDGFFIMVEGGKIDWACHANDTATVIHDMLAFDEAVEQALLFAEEHPNETLVVVTGDHETGGLALGRTGSGLDLRPLMAQRASLDLANAETKAYIGRAGANANFEEALAVLLKHVRAGLPGDTAPEWFALSEAELDVLRAAFINMKEHAADPASYGAGGIAEAMRNILNARAGIGWTSNGHTGTVLPIMAKGPGAWRFSGSLDNTDIPRIIADLMRVDLGVAAKH